MNVVCDASTLIALARIGQLDILPQVGAQVVIPMAVYEEVVVKGAGKPGSDEIPQASWIETRGVSDRDVVAQFRTVLGAQLPPYAERCIVPKLGLIHFDLIPNASICNLRLAFRRLVTMMFVGVNSVSVLRKVGTESQSNQ